MTCSFHAEPEKIKVYAYFFEPNEKVMVEFANFGEAEDAGQEDEQEIEKSVDNEKKLNENSEFEYEAKVRAFLRMLRKGEGTKGDKGYKMLFGRKDFTKSPYNKSMETHPKIDMPFGKTTSSAAGAYQIMGYTFDDMKKLREKYNVESFDEESQDKLCLIILKHNYVQDRADSFYSPKYYRDKEKKVRDIVRENKAKEWRKRFKGQNGDIIKMIIEDDIKRASLVSSLCWASLPDSPYGQQKSSYTFENVKELYDKYLDEELNENQEFKTYLKKGFLKEFGYTNFGKKNYEVEEDEKNITNNEDLKDNQNSLWHNPVDYPQRTYYNSSAVHKEQNGAFGPVRTKIIKGKAVAKNHQGLDIFADIKTPCKASLDGVIYSYENEGEKGYGNVLVIEVSGEDLRKAKREYSLEFSAEREQGNGFDWNAKKYYLRYAHLSAAVKKSGKVFAGDLVAYSGDTGNAKGVPNPHVHFEVAMKPSGNGIGIQNRCNPAFFVRLKPIKKDIHDEVKNRRLQEKNNKRR